MYSNEYLSLHDSIATVIVWMVRQGILSVCVLK